MNVGLGLEVGVIVGVKDMEELTEGVKEMEAVSDGVREGVTDGETV